jgi:hypothetical protein
LIQIGVFKQLVEVIHNLGTVNGDERTDGFQTSFPISILVAPEITEVKLCGRGLEALVSS